MEILYLIGSIIKFTWGIKFPGLFLTHVYLLGKYYFFVTKIYVIKGMIYDIWTILPLKRGVEMVYRISWSNSKKYRLRWVWKIIFRVTSHTYELHHYDTIYSITFTTNTRSVVIFTKCKYSTKLECFRDTSFTTIIGEKCPFLWLRISSIL